MKNNKINSDALIVPIYINEKIVLDMLAIIEDGFSLVSQVNYTEHQEKESTKSGGAIVAPKENILGKLLKIDISGEISNNKHNTQEKNISKERFHTNVSMLSRFREVLLEKSILKKDYNISEINVGDFIEIKGELQKNPIIDWIETFIDVFRISNIFNENIRGNKKGKNNQAEDVVLSQMRKLLKELTSTGTIDFILNNKNYTVILSSQEQYLSNDNISEILGGTFKVLGKVIYVCKDNEKEVSLLRKTTLSILPDEVIDNTFSKFNADEFKDYNLPEIKTKVKGQSIIVIPIAIYA